MPDEAKEQAAEAAPSYADLIALVADLRAEVAELHDAVAGRDERIAELEKSLDEARRSTKRQAAPFSKGEPAEEPKRPGRRSGERHGRHGHRLAPPGADRELAAPLPDACPSCGGGVEHVRDAEQWQVELPDPRPVTTRFVIGVGRCRDCGARVQGRHPEQASDAVGAAASQLGPQAKSFAAWLHYGLGLSFAKCASLLGRLGIGVTAGALCSGAQRTGTALVPVHAEICRRINDAPAVVMEETGWREGGRGVWLWVATTDSATAYWVAEGRGFEEATLLVDADYAGVVVRDGWAPTAATPPPPTKAAWLICSGVAITWPLTTPPGRITPPRRWPTSCRPPSTPGTCHAAGDASWSPTSSSAWSCWPNRPTPTTPTARWSPTCTTSATPCSLSSSPGVDAANWRAEQAIRPAVVNRKLWGGNRTRRGADTQGRIMSVLRTAAQQGVDPVDWLARFARAPDLAVVPLFIPR